MINIIEELEKLAKMYADEDPDTPVSEFTVYQAAREIERLREQNVELKKKWKRAVELAGQSQGNDWYVEGSAVCEIEDMEKELGL